MRHLTQGFGCKVEVGQNIFLAYPLWSHSSGKKRTGGMDIGWGKRWGKRSKVFVNEMLPMMQYIPPNI